MGLIDMELIRISLDEGKTLLQALLSRGVALAHDCGGTLACASCRVAVREGPETLGPASEDELDMLERAGADAPGARLACQVSGAGEVVVELPRQEAPAHHKTLPLTLTGQAARFLSQQLARHPAAAAVRLRVEPAGCSGFGYRLEHAETTSDDDAVFVSNGVRIAVDPLSLPYLQGTRIDLVREGLARRLRFDNPNARQSCGCGESFGT